ncbi:MAG: sugar-transfer associated ATP-grasp domain-containing protein [Balneolaceae bacterium]
MKQFTGQTIRQLYNAFEKWRNYANSRNQAKSIREQIVRKKGYTALNSELKKKIRSYAEKRFGSAGYAPWLETYTELNDEFKEGWIPDDYYTFEMIPELNPRTIAHISNLKTFDHRLFKEFAIQPLAVRVNGSFYDHTHHLISFGEVKEKLREYGGEVVIKRDLAPSSKEIEFKEAISITEKEFPGKYDYLIQPAVKQHKIMDTLHPESVNTIRITTCIAPGGEISVKHQSLRFGKEGIRISNMAAGGLSLFLDKEGRAVTNAYNELGMDAGDIHPTTGVRYRELQIPGMPESIDKCIESHHRFPYLRFIAWDIFIDREARPKLIEWNAWMPGMWEAEALTGPLWG